MMRLAVLLLLVAPAVMAELVPVQIRITNLYPEGGAFYSPLWFGFHDGTFDQFTTGENASEAMEALAEDGNFRPLGMAMGMATDGTANGGAFSAPLFPGQTQERPMMVDPANRFFSFASMILPSNDAFVANNNPTQFEIFDEEGNFQGLSFVMRAVYDAGTEVNDELIENVAPTQSGPNTGVSESNVITLHPGFMEGGRILTERPEADITFGSNKLLIQIMPRFDEQYDMTFDQEVGVSTPSVTDQHQDARFGMNFRDGQLHWSMYTRFVDGEEAAPTAAHLHFGAAGSNGPVIVLLCSGEDCPDDYSHISGVINASDVMGNPNTPIPNGDFGALSFFNEEGSIYANLHSPISPPGILRGQLFRPISFDLSSDNEVPPVMGDASGSAKYRRQNLLTPAGRGTTFTIDLEIDELEEEDNIVQAHLHLGRVGMNGPLLNPDGDSPFFICHQDRDGVRPCPQSGQGDRFVLDMPESVFDLLGFFETGFIYVNVHSDSFPSGLIRGQVTDVPVSFPLSPAQEVPPVMTDASGYFQFLVNPGTLTYFLTVGETVNGPITAAHLHVGEVGSNGGVAMLLCGGGSMERPPCPTPGQGVGFTLIQGLNTEADVDKLGRDLLAGRLYVNVHSTDFPAGVLRGQLVHTPFQRAVLDLEPFAYYTFDNALPDSYGLSDIASTNVNNRALTTQKFLSDTQLGPTGSSLNIVPDDDGVTTHDEYSLAAIGFAPKFNARPQTFAGCEPGSYHSPGSFTVMMYSCIADLDVEDGYRHPLFFLGRRVSSPRQREFELSVESDGGIRLSGLVMAPIKRRRVLLRTSAGTITAGEPFHIAATIDVDAKSASIFLNGAMVATGPIPMATTSLWNSMGIPTMGSYARDGRFLFGRYDEVAIFHKSVDAADLQSLLTIAPVSTESCQLPE